MSRQVTFAPAARRAVSVADPMKPVPPVIRTWVSVGLRDRFMVLQRVNSSLGVKELGRLLLLLIEFKLQYVGTRSAMSLDGVSFYLGSAMLRKYNILQPPMNPR